jgi:hypothetical protein
MMHAIVFFAMILFAVAFAVFGIACLFGWRPAFVRFLMWPDAKF